LTIIKRRAAITSRNAALGEESEMAQPAATMVDDDSIIDALPVNRFHVKLVAWCFLIALTDGYDVAVIGFTGPSLVREWHISNLTDLTPIFSAGLFGLLFGPLMFGQLGDRFGRKNVLIASGLLYGLLSFATMAAGSIWEMVFFRFLTGIALGGVLPSALALVIEYAPKNFKLTFGMIVNLGIVAGAGLPGPIAVWLVPTHGWQSLFFVGGVAPIVVTACLTLALPESVKFLALHPRRRAKLQSVLARLGPSLQIDANTFNLVPSEPESGGRYTQMLYEFRQLFVGRFAIITPLLWLMFMICLMSTYFFQTWMPTLLASIGVPASRAVLSFTWFATGGFIATVVLSRPIDKYGFVLLTLLFVFATPVVASLGLILTSESVVLALALMATGFCLLGLVCGVLASAGAIYPTRVRSTGIGWTTGMGRLGGVAGPIVGGILVGLNLPLRQLYYVAAAPLVVGAIASLVLVWVSPRATGGMKSSK
jgi:MFS transporter, AAHS family, 4-hydroxybenzoate transporter